jgi:transposase InsO family protein
MAIWARDERLDGLFHHSDAGQQYTAIRYTDALTGAGALPSIGSVGDSYDNALAESTIGQIKAELIHRRGLGAPSSSSNTPCSSTSTGGTIEGCTLLSACAPPPKPKRPSTLKPRL